jgi:hypothetical protein
MFAVEIRTIDPISKVMVALGERGYKWFDTYVEAIAFVDVYNSDCPADKEALFVPVH